MTFSNIIREEICRTINDKERKFSCLYGILLFSKIFSQKKIIIQTESTVLAGLLPELFRSVFGGRTEFKMRESSHMGRDMMYSFSAENEELIERICNVYNIAPGDRRINESNLINGGTAEFIAGIFLCCGSMTDPNKEYHIEFNIPSENLCRDLCSLLTKAGIRCKAAQRRSMWNLYIENSECIEDLLTFMGAGQCTIELINIKINKDFRNKANRIRNCDLANVNKSVAASIEQINTIKKIQNYMKIEDLPDELRELASLRLENEDCSLEELGAMLSRPIGKSGVSRRFLKLKKLAENLESDN